MTLKKAEEDGVLLSWGALRGVCSRVSVALSGHYGHYRYLQVIKRCIFRGDKPFLLNSRYRLLVDFLMGLNESMDLQEAKYDSGHDEVVFSYGLEPDDLKAHLESSTGPGTCSLCDWFGRLEGESKERI